MIFVNSMSDLFHKEMPEEFYRARLRTMERADWHTFQVLTKRSSLMRNFLRRRYGAAFGPQHIWCGVSIEDGSKLSPLRHLTGTPAGTRFLSIEPLIGRVGKIDLNGIDWVIVGGESGPLLVTWTPIGFAKFATNATEQGYLSSSNSGVDRGPNRAGAYSTEKIGTSSR